MTRDAKRETRQVAGRLHRAMTDGLAVLATRTTPEAQAPVLRALAQQCREAAATLDDSARWADTVATIRRRQADHFRGAA